LIYKIIYYTYWKVDNILKIYFEVSTMNCSH
jgi:hypothetical protein